MKDNTDNKRKYDFKFINLTITDTITLINKCTLYADDATLYDVGIPYMNCKPYFMRKCYPVTFTHEVRFAKSVNMVTRARCSSNAV